MSIAQILCSLLVCAVLEVGIVFAQNKAIVWPASALLTGSGVALLLRIPGTEHGDWFSLNGVHIVAATAALSLLSKYVLRVGGRQLFNPSNIGLVGCFLLLGPQRVDPQDLWWGPTNAGLVVAIVIIVVGGLSITRLLGFVGLAVGFWVTFASGVAVSSASGHCMTARWSFEPVCDSRYFTTVALSPEVLIFLFFMITDPRSTPRGRVARTVFGASVGMVAGLLVAFQRTEFATKVAILAALVVVCVARGLVERTCPAPGAPDDRVRAWLVPPGSAAVRRAARATALVLLPLLAYLVWVVAVNRRFDDEAVPAQVAMRASRTAIDDTALPPVEIDPNAARIAQGFDRAAAQAAARDLVDDLEIEIRAVREHNRALAMTSSTGARLDAVVALIDASSAGRDATVPTYRFTNIRAVLSRESPQAKPQLRFETTATVIQLHADGTLGATTAIDATVVISLVEGPQGAHLISAAT